MSKNESNIWSFLWLTIVMAAFVLFIGTEIPKWETAHKDLDRRLHKIEQPEIDPVRKIIHKAIYECDFK